MALRFRYKSIERPKPLEPKVSPIIPVKFLGRNGESFEAAALIDSGADYSVIFEEHAQILGIDLSKAKRSEAQGVGGKVPTWICSVDVEISGRGEHRKFRYSLPCMVIPSPAKNHPLLLGRTGFFEKFEITFKEKNRDIILKPLC